MDSQLAREFRGQARRLAAQGVLSPDELAREEARLAVKFEPKDEPKEEGSEDWTDVKTERASPLKQEHWSDGDVSKGRKC